MITSRERHLVYTVAYTLLPQDGTGVDSRAVIATTLSRLLPTIPALVPHHVIGVLSSMKRHHKARFKVLVPGKKTLIFRV